MLMKAIERVKAYFAPAPALKALPAPPTTRKTLVADYDAARENLHRIRKANAPAEQRQKAAKRCKKARQAVDAHDLDQWESAREH